MHHTLVTIAAALALSASSASYAASNSASVKLSNLSIQVFDLVPGDAQLPSYELFPQNVESTVAIYRGSVNASTSQTAVGFFGPQSMSITDSPFSSATASTVVTATGLEANVEGPGEFDTIGTRISMGDSLSPLIRLAPGAGIVITGEYDVSVSLACAIAHPKCHASVSLSANLFPGGFAYHRANTPFFRVFSTSNDSQTFAGTAGASYLNFTGEALDLAMTIHATASIGTVPEVKVSGLLVAGLCTVWTIRRRWQLHGTPSYAAA